MKFITLNLVVPAYTSKKRGITPILTLMNPTNPQLLAPPLIKQFKAKLIYPHLLAPQSIDLM